MPDDAQVAVLVQQQSMQEGALTLTVLSRALKQVAILVKGRAWGEREGHAMGGSEEWRAERWEIMKRCLSYSHDEESPISTVTTARPFSTQRDDCQFFATRRITC